MEIRAHPRLVGEEYLNSQTLRAASQPRIVIFLPAVYGLRVLLIGSPQGPLGAHAHLRQRATHRAMAQIHLEALGNEDGPWTRSTGQRGISAAGGFCRARCRKPT